MFNEILELSSLNFFLESALIVGHYNRLANREDKNSVWDSYRERGVTEEQIAILKKQVADQAGRDVDREFRSMGYQFTTDLDKFEYPLMNYILTVYEHWEKGSMPFSGTISDQPNKVVEIMNLLNGLKQEQEDKAHKKNGTTT